MRCDVDSLLREQQDYYSARASEYDRTAYPEDDLGASVRAARLLDTVRPRGHVLEIACGTGQWTQLLAARAERVVGLDSAPQVLEIAATRTAACRNVVLQRGDVWHWVPPTGERYDMVFMAFWLSHVPRQRWSILLKRVAAWLRPGGRIAVVDETPTNSGKERWVSFPADEVALRALEDGRVYRIFKVHVAPEDLETALRDLRFRPESAVVMQDWVAVTACFL